MDNGNDICMHLVHDEGQIQLMHQDTEDVLKKVNPYITAANIYPTKNTPRVRSRWPTWRLPGLARMRVAIDRGNE